MEENLKDKLVKLIEGFINNWELAGLSVGIIRNNEIYFQESFGKANYNSGLINTTNSVFNTGSLAKQVVVFAIMLLHEKRLLDIDGFLYEYLPEFFIDQSDFKKITLKQLLTHTSGLPDNDSDYDYNKRKYTQDEKVNYPLKNAIIDFADQKVELVSKPGTKFNYSNLGYNILGEVIARVSGSKFEDYINQNIFTPLQMNSSCFLSIPEISSPENQTIGHVRAPELTALNYYAYQKSNAPCSAFNSNIEDILKWIKVNINNGTSNSKKYLESDSYKNFIYNPNVHFSDTGFWKDAGLSWFLGEYECHQSIISLGGNDGYNSSIVMFPDLSLGFAVLSNTEYAPIYAITTAIINILMGIKQNNKRKIPAYLPLGNLISEMGINKGIEKFSNIIETNPDKYDFSDGSIDILADHFMMMNKHENAIEIANYNSKLYPESETTIIRMGLVYEMLGDKNKSMKYFEEALNINPKNINLKNHYRNLIK